MQVHPATTSPACRAALAGAAVFLVGWAAGCSMLPLPQQPTAAPRGAPTPTLNAAFATVIAATVAALPPTPTPPSFALLPTVQPVPNGVEGVHPIELSTAQFVIDPASPGVIGVAVQAQNPNADYELPEVPLLVSALDATGRVVGRYNTTVSERAGENEWLVVEPITVTAPPSQVDVQIQYTRTLRAVGQGPPPVNVTVLSPTIQWDGAVIHVRGNLHNDASGVVPEADVACVFLDGQSHVTGVAHTTLATLPPGSTTAFDAAGWATSPPSYLETSASVPLGS